MPGGGLNLANAATYGGPAKPWQHLAPGEVFVALTDITQDGRILGSPARLAKDERRDCVVTHHVARVEVFQPQALDVSYLYYALQTRAFRGHVAGCATGTTVRAVSPHDAEIFQMMIPPLSEQCAIAEVLGALDDKIEANRTVAGNAEALAIRLPMSIDETTSVGAVAHSSHRTVASAYFAGKEVEHFSLPAFDASRLPLLESGNQIKSSKYLLEGPTVLISKLNPHIPRVWMATPSGAWPAVTSTEFVGLASATDSPTEVLWALCASDGVRSQLLEMVKGTTGSHQRVSREDIFALQIPDPTAMGRDLRDAITFLVRLAGGVRRESARLGSLRDDLLPRLLSGEVRVREAEARVKEAM